MDITKDSNRKSIGKIEIFDAFSATPKTFIKMVSTRTFRFARNITSFKMPRTFRFADYTIPSTTWKKLLKVIG